MVWKVLKRRVEQLGGQSTRVLEVDERSELGAKQVEPSCGSFKKSKSISDATSHRRTICCCTKLSMPPSTRSFGLSDLALGQLTSKSYICSSCRHIALRQRIANQQSIRLASSSNIPFTEKIRRKIWGTDNPPGLADPYGGPSFLERRRNERALQKQSQLQPTPEEEMAQGQKMQEFAPGEKIRTDSPISARNELEKGGYVPADTWDGLQHLGHKGHWSEMPPTPLDVFSP